jgi:hypothetical protein
LGEGYFQSIDKILEMLVFFMGVVEMGDLDSLEELIGELAPHIFSPNATLKAKAHKLFTLLISDHKSTRTGGLCRQVKVALENQQTEAEKKEAVWRDEDTLREYIGTLVKGLVYGISENIEDNIELTKFIIQNTGPALLAQQLPRVLGPVIRVSSYPLNLRQK